MRHINGARPLPDLLRLLALSNLVPDEIHRLDLQRAAQSLEAAMPGNPARVAIHSGTGADPVLEAVESVEHDLTEMLQRCADLAGELTATREWAVEAELDRRRRDKVRCMASEAQNTLTRLGHQLADLTNEVGGYDLYIQSRDRIREELERVFEDHS